MERIQLYDTTLRDGAQGEDINFTLEDKIRIALRLDEFGFDFIEGGWPGSNPRDLQFFKEIQSYNLKNARISAFGSTCNPKNTPESDPNLKALIDAGCPVVTLVGKSWDVHVTDALRTTLERNLEIITGSLAFLKKTVPTLMYDAEHFFDGFKRNRAYTVQTLEAAVRGGADCLVLCDTNGGSLTSEIFAITQEVQTLFPGLPLGIHVHNDAELAVANTLAAVEAGVVQVQGTINGLGERCGNANLCSILPALVLKMGRSCGAEANLVDLLEISRFVNELANRRHEKNQPYVGRSAFAHKGGIHISAVQRNPETYEHIPPGAVGNVQRILVSDLSGRSTILNKAKKYGLDIESRDPIVKQILKDIKALENQGFQFEGAEASFEMLMNRAMGVQRKYFDLIGFRVIDQKVKEDEPPSAEATIMVGVGGEIEHTAASGDGPVNALDNALRKALEKFYPELKHMRLEDYKVRVLPAGRGTGSKVRVLIESKDKEENWGTVGVSHDIIEASWQALVDSISYKLYREEKKRRPQ